MRWSIRSPTAAIAGCTVALFALFWIDALGTRSQANPAPTVLSLEDNLIFVNTFLLTENEEPLPPAEFNPDPGASQRIEPEAPPELFPPVLPQLPEYGEEPLPRSLELPRKGVREVVPRRTKLGYGTYPQSEQGEGLLPASRPEPNRWFIGFGRWKRYADPSTETPYQSQLQLWHPYLPSELKGDASARTVRNFSDLATNSFTRTISPSASIFSKARLPSGRSIGRCACLAFTITTTSTWRNAMW